MVRPASFDRNGIKRGVWSEEEDNKLRACIDRFGHSNWRLLPLVAGLKRCGKSCRLRWVNYLKPGLRRGNFTKDEENRIIELHNQLGNKWSVIAAYFPRRTDNDIKNYWHAHVMKRSKRGHDSESRAGRAITNNDSSIEAGLDQDTVEAFNQAAENMGVFESNVDSDYNAAALYQRCFSNLGIDCRNFVQEEFDYSEWGINGHWNLSAAAKSQQDFWAESVEEDVFNIKFW